ncbi:cell envelope-related transcriptional attenuator [Alicyclobacillus hesperidum URH17-3-68]|nr:cell envelope-related transcriptional attenuator [Alicyclobacillus hesperidum URH17-3-68]
MGVVFLTEKPKKPYKGKLASAGRYAAVAFGLLAAAATFVYGNRHILAHKFAPATGSSSHPIQPQIWPHAQMSHIGSATRQTILFIGSDERPKQGNGNSDVLMVASLDDEHRRIELLSIPRDTQVPFPDGHYHKINDALAEGGPSLTCGLVEQLIGMPIDHYALTEFDGLVRIVDRMGGIDINVPRNMYYRTGDKKYGIIRLHKGTQHLTGEQALGFVRYRHDALGDIGRTERQQAFLVAVKNQLLRPETIPQLPAIAYDLLRSVDTDLTAVDLGRLIAHAHTYRSYSTIHATLPGSFHDPDATRPGDLSYWIVNPKEAHYVAKRFFIDGVVPKNTIQDPQLTRTWTTPADSDH